MVTEPLEPYVLLAKALRTLTDVEQGVVLSSLLPALPLGATTTTWLGTATARQARVSMWLADEATGDKVGFLLRLPAQTHAALKAWADEHGHSMNVVVRGVVQRFLDGQTGGPGITETIDEGRK